MTHGRASNALTNFAHYVKGVNNLSCETHPERWVSERAEAGKNRPPFQREREVYRVFDKAVAHEYFSGAFSAHKSFCPGRDEKG
jgi:hypothetical protein